MVKGLMEAEGLYHTMSVLSEIREICANAGKLFSEEDAVVRIKKRLEDPDVICSYECLEKYLDENPVEAKPVVHAHWEYAGESDDKKIYRCTNCQVILPGTGNFCKECGAQMDEEVE